MKKIIPVFLLALTVGLVSLVGGSTLKANAGQIEKSILDPVAFEEGVTQADWVIDEGIEIKNGRAVFSAATESGTRLLNRTRLYAETETDGFTVEATLSVSNTDCDRRVGIGFGFDRLRYVLGDENTNFAYITRKDGACVVGLCAYGSDGEKTELVTPVTVTSAEHIFKIVGKNGGNVEFLVDGNRIYKGKMPTDDIGGYFGFTVDGAASEGCVCSVGLPSADNNYYDRPENVNIYDTFEENYIDSSVWSLYSNGPYLKGVAVKNGTLAFIDSNQSTVTTKYRYSNYRIAFDVPYIKRTTEYNSLGTLTSPVSSWFGLVAGIDTDDYSSVGTVDNLISKLGGYFLSFSASAVDGVASSQTTALFGPTTARRSYILPSKYHLWDTDNDGRTLNVSFTNFDGTFNLDIKWDDETEYYHVFTADYGMTSGYISFCGYGSGETYSQYKANFALDNIRITNCDYEGNVLTGVEAEYTGFPNVGDYGYVDGKDPAYLLSNGADFDEKKKGCGSAVTGSYIAAAVFAVAAFGLIVIGRKRYE